MPLSRIALALNELAVPQATQKWYCANTCVDYDAIPSKVRITCSLLCYSNHDINTEKTVVSITKVFPKEYKELGTTITQQELLKAILSHVAFNKKEFVMINYQ